VDFVLPSFGVFIEVSSRIEDRHHPAHYRLLTSSLSFIHDGMPNDGLFNIYPRSTSNTIPRERQITFVGSTSQRKINYLAPHECGIDQLELLIYRFTSLFCPGRQCIQYGIVSNRQVAIFPIIAIVRYLMKFDNLEVTRATSSGIVILGLVLFWVATPILLPGVMFLFVATISEAVAVVLHSKSGLETPRSALVFESAPVCREC
jgi:hypothetical protein